MPINGFRVILLIGVFLTASGLAGCGVSLAPTETTPSAETGDFLGISFSAFDDDRPFPVYTDAVTSQSTRVSFPEDLFDTVPLEAVMVLHKFKHTHGCRSDCEICSSIDTMRSKLPEARLIAIANEATRRHRKKS